MTARNDAGSATSQDYQDSAKLRLPQASAIVMGSIIGVGVFSLPYSLSEYGPISIVAMAVTTVGALALAMMYSALSKRIDAPGGPYAYAREAFGNATGFFNAWSYWITAWAGNAAIAVGWVYYVDYFFPGDFTNWEKCGIALAGLWVPALINLSGLKNIGSVQLVSTILKFVPLVLLSFVGIFWIKGVNFDDFNASNGSALSAVLGAMAILLFSYLGVETATVTAAAVRDPKKNVSRATILGTLACAVVYIMSLVTVFGVVPNQELAEEANQASYAVAANQIVGGTWSGYVVAACVVVSGLGALNGWVLICAEMPRAAAADGLFPHSFSVMSKRGVPTVGVLAATVLASVVTVISSAGNSGATIFNTLVYMTGITAAIPYGFSALAQIKMRIMDAKKMQISRFGRDVLVALVALVFSILFIIYSRNTDDADAQWYTVYGPYLMTVGAFVLGIPVYLYMHNRMTEVPELPDYSVVDEPSSVEN
ncbi:amino acid permease [Gordonia sp. VNK21]|uniref:amino acid permease n=1 Tax=Gordonia sp. VNK21 TaxID=3382483 RepID=UPI0038D49ABA